MGTVTDAGSNPAGSTAVGKGYRMNYELVNCPKCGEPVMVHPDILRVVKCPYCNSGMIVGRAELVAFAIDADVTYWKAIVTMPEVARECCFIITSRNTRDACKVLTAAVNSSDWVLESIIRITPEEAAHHLADDSSHAIPLNYGPQFGQ